MKALAPIYLLIVWASSISAHYIFPVLRVNGVSTADWEYIRQTDNSDSNFYPLEDVTSNNLRCYDSQRSVGGAVKTHDVAAGSTIGFGTGEDGVQIIFHQSVTNVYMAKVPDNTSIEEWEGGGEIWFKVYEIPAVTNGGTLILFPSSGLRSVDFKLPPALPSGRYLVRVENIALHYAMKFGGVQFYISCAQINILEGPDSGARGNPGPLVSIPGVYDGTASHSNRGDGTQEPGLLININHPIPEIYIQPGPVSTYYDRPSRSKC
ncbi:hypothetical protein FA15DRAFT_717806 [Coprinopsis marcescibilis]|uniref:lytic cellulose monooxygenase (C4-dehydrogenating) n=1 Tax=Coprinopsis marcescibilis TaxID=230819 RepID=A0A5C3KLI9_COPMA|nr:hypothetical protein FA15DRAFT_717806 [Coprinopsis marcescibilis]